MTIPLVASSDTTGIFTGRVNQTIGIINQLTDGVLTVNGSIIFSNTTFALSLPSLAVANSLIMTQTTGNSIFLQSSGLVANGTIYAKSSGNSLIVSNNSIIGGNVSLTTGILTTCNEIQSSTTSAIGQFRAVYGNYGIILRNDATNFYVLTTGNVANPNTASFNTLRPFSINVSTGAVSLDGTGAGGTIVGGALNINGQVTTQNVAISSNLTIGSSGVLNVKNSSIFNGVLTCSGGVNLSNSGLAFNTSGTTKLQYNASDFNGTGGIEVTNNLQINGKLNVIGTSNFTGNSVFANISSTLSSATTGIFTNLSGTTAVIQTANITSTLTSMDLLSNYKEIRSYGLGVSNGGGQFRAVQGNYAIILRNDGTSFNILQTANSADPTNSPWNSYRPFTLNLSSGSLSIDGTGQGVVFGGPIQIGSTSNITSGISVTSNSISIPNNGGLYFKDAFGSNVLQLSLNSDKTLIYGAGSGLSIMSRSGTKWVDTDTSGNFYFLNNKIYGIFATSYGGAYYGKDGSNNDKPLIQLTADNWNQLWCGTSGLRIASSTGTRNLFAIDDGTANITHSPDYGSNNGFTTTNFIKAGAIISSNYGYLCKAGQIGGFRTNVFNIDWNGTQSVIYIDNAAVAVFSNGTNTSDRRIKSDIRTSPTGSLDRVNQLSTYLFRFKNNGLIENDTIDKLGFIADELQKIIPQAVTGSPDAVNENGQIIPQGIDPVAIIAELVGAVKELSNKYTLLDQRFALIENK